MCLECATGKYQPLNIATTNVCSDCGGGQFAASGSAVACSMCAIGQFQDLTSAVEYTCKLCAPGSYQNSTKSVACTLCPPGKKLTIVGTSEDHDALDDCVDCPVLQFSPYKGQSEDCYPCLTANVAGSSTCAGCNPGTYKNRSGVCLNCPIGFYTNQQSLSQCKECPIGYFAVTKLSLDGILRYDRCESCSRGTYGIQKKAKTFTEGCNNCTSGTYSDVEALTRADECKGCPKGTWSSSVGVTEKSACNYCDTGKYGADSIGINAESFCTQCDRGTFLDKVGTFGSQICTKYYWKGFLFTLYAWPFHEPNRWV